MEGLVIRPIVESDMPLLAAHFDEGSPEQPLAGLELQRRDKGGFLLALLEGRPVGYLAMEWQPERRWPADRNRNAAYLSQFIVLKAFRSQGIGTATMKIAEEMAAERGFDLMTLGIDIDNQDAERFYHRLGYRDAGLAPIEDGGSFRTWDGRLHQYEETWRFLEKVLVRR